MQTLKAGRLLELHERLVIDKGWFETAHIELTKIGGGHAVFGAKEFLQLRNAVAEIEEIASGLSLVATNVAATRTRQAMDNVGRPPPGATITVTRDAAGTMFRHLADIASRVRDDCAACIYFQISPSSAKMFDLGAEPFGREVFLKFPSTQEDIEEAGKCLALHRNTASVFHLMRAMEVALRVIALKLGISLQKSNGDYLPWLTIVGQLKTTISLLPKSEQEEWMGVHNLFWGVGKAVRNPTMHPSKNYSDEQAAANYDAVRGFMSHLAPLV